MKKTILAAFAALVMMASCSQTEKGFVINGTAEGIEDGDSVFLYEVSFNVENNLISSAVVKDGQFLFKGEPMGAKLVALVAKHGDEPVAEQSFIVEDDNVAVVLRPGSDAGTVEGGEEQRLWNMLNETIAKYMVQMDELSSQLNDSTLEEAKRNEIQQGVDSLSDELDRAAIQFIVDQMPSEFSNIALIPCSQIPSQEKLQPLLDAFAEKQPDASNYKKYMEENR